jgi:hypothetical protein
MAAMEAHIVQLPAPATPTNLVDRAPRLMDSAPRPQIWIEGERLIIERLAVFDPVLAGIVADRAEPDRPALVERALRIGLLAVQDAGATMNVDAVRTEFERLLRQTELANERATATLEQVLRTNFADGEGRLPRTLDAFLGDRGALRKFVVDLFDDTKRDSAIGRMSALLGTYFDGDASKLAALLDPTRLQSPLHQFREEVRSGFTHLGERLAALEAAAQARGAERARSTAKGTDFEDLIERLLGEIARGAGDTIDRTGLSTGDTIRSKKGDFVLGINDALTRGADLRIVVEAKDRPMSARAIREELREARANRGAAVGLVVFTPAHAPSGVGPFDIRAGDVYCVLDPEAPEPATLEAAVRLARLLALTTVDERELEIDTAAVGQALAGIREQLEQIKTLRMQLTSISTATKHVWNGLDTLRSGILERVGSAEAALRPAVR